MGFAIDLTMELTWHRHGTDTATGTDTDSNTIDNINSRYGSSTLKIASEGIEKVWKMKRENVASRVLVKFFSVACWFPYFSTRC